MRATHAPRSRPARRPGTAASRPERASQNSPHTRLLGARHGSTARSLASSAVPDAPRDVRGTDARTRRSRLPWLPNPGGPRPPLLSAPAGRRVSTAATVRHDHPWSRRANGRRSARCRSQPQRSRVSGGVPRGCGAGRVPRRYLDREREALKGPPNRGAGLPAAILDPFSRGSRGQGQRSRSEKEKTAA
jgi:hypothetical protein